MKYFAIYPLEPAFSDGSRRITQHGKIPDPTQYARHHLPDGYGIYIGSIQVSAMRHKMAPDGKPIALEPDEVPLLPRQERERIRTQDPGAAVRAKPADSLLESARRLNPDDRRELAALLGVSDAG